MKAPMIPKGGDNFSPNIVNDRFKDESDDRYLQAKESLDKHKAEF